MENTLKNKVKFMSAHIYCANIYIEFENSPQHNYGQRLTPTVLGHVEFGKQLFFGGTYPNIERAYLELKPLPPISDEDALQVSKIVNKIFPKASSVEDGRKFIEKYTTRSVLSLNLKRVSTLSHVEHYLRSRGYALPFMGLSVEELVNRGWVKLKGETK